MESTSAGIHGYRIVDKKNDKKNTITGLHSASRLWGRRPSSALPPYDPARHILDYVSSPLLVFILVFRYSPPLT
uniref:Uncharacterized protein n=1 Tax=Human betaherpesvirus 6 TaxID=10368 RepID=A0A5P9S7J8_9BETA|nr:hypothetical protein [Human betaherpesvirus 6]QFV47795.1 hypothetical protein [Human betaherpesvirus 6]QFV49791.1 hypothetical protein [Human betaherpesvirus 6]QFV49806.1 hypothetical protein [Human betaherpesvirus 6]QFX16102.1 hypothetical protein [Human betaherpesvirus 6]